MERGFKRLTECLSQTFLTTFYPRSATERETISVGVGVRSIEGKKAGQNRSSCIGKESEVERVSPKGSFERGGTVVIGILTELVRF